MPGTCPFSQEMKSPLRQGSQVKSQPPNQPTPTRSPACHVVTPSPTVSTTPATSWPGARGNELPIEPITVTESEWQTPQACTLTRTCPGPGSGMSTSTSSNFSFAAGTRAIFMVATSARLLPSIDALLRRGPENNLSNSEEFGGQHTTISQPSYLHDR